MAQHDKQGGSSRVTPRRERRPRSGKTAVGGPGRRQNSDRALREREKELTALHAAAAILAGSDADTVAMLQKLADLLPPAFQFPASAGACIRLGEIEVRTPSFTESQWALSEPFTTAGGISGLVKVIYFELPPKFLRAPFLREERSLVQTIARLLCGAFEHRAARAALQVSEEQLRRVAESIDEVYWLYDWASGEHIYLNAAFEKVWGATVDNGREIARMFRASILAEDRPAVDAFLEQQRRQLPSEVRYRIRRPDGSVRWIHDRAFPIRDPSGRPYRTAGIAKDVTADEGAIGHATSSVARLALLTPRQREVLQLLAEGNSVKEVAFRLGRSAKTIETHKADLMQRLELPDLAAVVRFAMRHGLVR